MSGLLNDIGCESGSLVSRINVGETWGFNPAGAVIGPGMINGENIARMGKGNSLDGRGRDLIQQDATGTADAVFKFPWNGIWYIEIQWLINRDAGAADYRNILILNASGDTIQNAGSVGGGPGGDTDGQCSGSSRVMFNVIDRTHADYQISFNFSDNQPGDDLLGTTEVVSHGWSYTTFSFRYLGNK
tara:strand:+ start:8830 stop:9390 length:561 start_codon:yes stop_codon:yes gene_type:complete